MKPKTILRSVEPMLLQAKQAFKSGRFQQSEQLLMDILRLQPHNADAWNWLGLNACEQRQFPKAAKHLAEAISLKPAEPLYLRNLGQIFERGGKLKEGLRYYEAAAKLRPLDPDLQLLLGCAFSRLQRQDEADACFRKVVELKPDCGEALMHLGDLPAAEAALLATLERQPDDADSYNLLGHIRTRLGQPLAAIEKYAKALQLRPDLHIARWNLALAQLLLGNYAEGFANYDARRKVFGDRERFYHLPDASRWRGDSLAGRQLLVWAEQGQGDLLQMARYLPLLKSQKQAQSLTVCCPKSLVRLFTRIPGVDSIVDTDSPLPDYELHCSFMDLPALFGTRLDNIPAAIPYLTPEPSDINKWQARLGSEPRLKVGIVWAGGKKTMADAVRSLTLTHFLPLAKVSDVCFVSLQKGEGASASRSTDGELPMLDWTSELGDFADTAALIETLDLVISVDTSVAHLAGALGKPVWLLNRFGSEWRWLLDRRDSPWYPSVTIYRQQDRDEWSVLLQEIAQDLRLWVDKHASGVPLPA
jgi:tetratricopeptide (TPR) repeat protein